MRVVHAKREGNIKAAGSGDECFEGGGRSDLNGSH